MNEGDNGLQLTGNRRVDTRGFVRRVIDCAGTQVVYLERGEGKPTVYLHGGGTFHGMQFAQQWSHERRLILPYHPNFGDSQDAPNIQAMHHYVLHYAELFDRLGLDQIDLIGTSFGGNLAAEIALYQKHRIRRLVLAAPAGLSTSEIQPADLSRVPPKELLSLLVAHMSTLTPYLPLDNDPDFASARGREGAAVGSVVRNLMMNGLDLSRWLSRLSDIPTLVLWGEEDRVLPVQMARLWQAAMGCEVRTYPGVGHLVFDESPEACEAVVRFLSTSSH